MPVELKRALFGYRERRVVRADDLRLSRGRCLGIFGPNGAGKTTLVRGMTGLLAPLEGEVVHPAGLRFGYLPQHRSMELHWPMTGYDAAAMAISSRRRFGWMVHDNGRLAETMRTLGVEPLAGRQFARLSGGQQQRLLLAGALASDPDVLVLDEPTDGLDVRSRQVLLEVLRNAIAEGLATVIISHDVEDLMAISNDVAWLHPADDPEHPSTVEVVTPAALVERVLSQKRSA